MNSASTEGEAPRAGASQGDPASAPPSLGQTLAVMGVAVVLLSLASPVLKFLVTEGQQVGLRDTMAISFCNVLFVGNLCAGLVTLLFFGPADILRRIAAVRRPGDILTLLAATAVAVAYPALIFTALETTSVTNITLLSRFEAVAFAVVAAIVFRTLPSRQQIVGYALIVIGILGLVLTGNMWMLAPGDRLVLLAGLVFSAAVFISRSSLEILGLKAYVAYKNCTSAVVFFVIALALYGPKHFMDAFRPELWGIMVVYAFFAVSLAELAWYSGIRSASPTVIANVSMVQPFMTLAFAYLLLNEVPNALELVAMVIILTGMILGSRGAKEEAPPEQISADRAVTRL